MTEIAEHAAQPTSVTGGLSEFLRLPHVDEEPRISKRDKRPAEVDADIDRALNDLRALAEVLQRAQRLLEVLHRHSVRRPVGCFTAGLPAILEGLFPHLAAEGMVSEPFDVLGSPTRIQCFHCPHHLAVNGLATVLNETRVGDFLRQRMPERVHEIGEELALVEELCRL